MAKLRGIRIAELNAISETLKLVLESSTNEPQLRMGIESVIKSVEAWQKNKTNNRVSKHTEQSEGISRANSC